MKDDEVKTYNVGVLEDNRSNLDLTKRIDDLENEIDRLAEENKNLMTINEQLSEELKRWKGKRDA
jgi:peptidoglycan hydrolase CwlO-like protein|tara:strand:+ start:937 stop:1131 length:195 start_codon:yes stop_codon:yes gene_type:complete